MTSGLPAANATSVRSTIGNWMKAADRSRDDLTQHVMPAFAFRPVVITKTIRGQSYTLPTSLSLTSSTQRWLATQSHYFSMGRFTASMLEVLLGPMYYHWVRNTGSVAYGMIALPVSMLFFSVVAVVSSIPPIQRGLLQFSIPLVMQAVDQTFRYPRHILLQRVQGRVLDVGCGGGAYLPYLTRATEIVAIEPKRYLHPTIRRVASDVGVADRLVLVESMEELVRDVANHGSFDWIILGNVLCEVPDVRATLQQVDRLMHPTHGVVYFSEHVASPRGSVRRFCQELVNPVRCAATGGCRCNRDSTDMLEATLSNVNVVTWTYDDVQLVYNVFVIGLAVKKQPGQ